VKHNLVEIYCNSDIERTKIIEFFDRVAVRIPESLGQHPDSVNYHPNPSGLQGFRTFSNSKLIVVLAPQGGT
jgi:hypothetical protein